MQPNSTNGDPRPATETPGGSTRRYVMGISGASGVVYSLRLLHMLLSLGHEVHLVVTDYGRRLLFDEQGITHVDFANLCPGIASSRAAARLIIHPNKDVG